MEMIAWDPAYLGRRPLYWSSWCKSSPGGSFKNRTDRKSSGTSFLAWRPATNASVRQRIAVLDQILRQDPFSGVGSWLVLLLPKRPDFGGNGLRPEISRSGRFGAADLTDPLVLESLSRNSRKVYVGGGEQSRRGGRRFLMISTLSQRTNCLRVISQLEQLRNECRRTERASAWQVLNSVIRHHRGAHPGASVHSTPLKLNGSKPCFKTVGGERSNKGSLWLFRDVLLRFRYISGKVR